MRTLLIMLVISSTLFACKKDKGTSLAKLQLEYVRVEPGLGYAFYSDSTGQPFNGRAYDSIGMLLEFRGEIVEGLKEGPWAKYEKRIDDLEDIANTGYTEYKSGFKHGIELTYHRGTKDTSYYTQYVEGKKHGASKAYYLNGAINSFGSYNRGKKNGEFSYFKPDGLMTSLEHFKNDTAHGVSKLWNEENGKLYYVRNYKDGEFHGLVTKYNHQKGTKVVEKVYQNGKLKGSKWFNEDGTQRPDLYQGIRGTWRSDDYYSDSSHYVIYKFVDNGKYEDHGLEMNGPLGDQMNKFLSDFIAEELNLDSDRTVYLKHFSSETGKMTRNAEDGYELDENRVRTGIFGMNFLFRIVHLEGDTMKTARDQTFYRIAP